MAASSSVAQYMNYAETDCNNEFAEKFLAAFLWMRCASHFGKAQISAAFKDAFLLLEAYETR
ncbi:MAG: hypothetical protein AAGA50_02520 [Pseudomonadota bacterium]